MNFASFNVSVSDPLQQTLDNLLEVRDLRIYFEQQKSFREVVKGISFDIANGERLALVGESGSGKSVTALALARLLPPEPLCRLSGCIRFAGQDLLKLNRREIARYRGRGISYIFQEPSTSLHPQFTIGSQIAEAVKRHQPQVKNVKMAVIAALDEVGIRNAELQYSQYPFQLSGGMQQRVMIAMALACKPRLLVADEPTTALDVTIQAQILDLIRHIQEAHQMSVLLITHNFGIVKGFANRLMVMYRGKIVESGITNEVLLKPEHDYTRSLIACVPRIGEKRHRLVTSSFAECEHNR